jgi:hypothetical protein
MVQKRLSLGVSGLVKLAESNPAKTSLIAGLPLLR